MNLPELPPRHEWVCRRNKITIAAIGTTFMQNKYINGREVVYWWDKCEVCTWGEKQWEVHSIVEGEQEAVNIMAALCWLGVSDYTFLEEVAHEHQS